jgi:S1-C subfamily serine protease
MNGQTELCPRGDVMSALKEMSNGLADAVKKAAVFTVTVDDGRGYPSTGVVYKNGLVVTAAQAVDSEDEIRVVLSDGKTVKARLAGRDPSHDLAALKLEEETTNVAEISDGDVRVGELVLALGRPTDDGVQASLGVVGVAKGNYGGGHGPAVEGVMRADATRYPGFSGGPLIDTEGRVVGINTFGFQYGSSLTIPVATAWAIADKLESEGSVKRGYLGLRSQPVEIPEGVELGRKQESGLLVVAIEKGSPAGESSLMVGDIIFGVDGAEISDHEGLIRKLSEGLVGKTIKLNVIRAGGTQEVEITVSEAPADGWHHHSGGHGHGHGHGRHRSHRGPHSRGHHGHRWWGW